MRTLIANASILYFNEDKWVHIKKGYLGIDGDTIDYVGADKPQGGYAYQKDLTGHLLIPGLYNTHTHSPMTLLRGAGSGLPLERWLKEAIFPLEAKLTPEDVRIGSRVAMMEMLASGTVSFTDMYDFPAATAREVIDAGMKASLNRPILALNADETYERNKRVEESLAFFDEYYGAAGGNVLVDFAIHAEYTSLPEVVERYGQACAQKGARMHLHLSETRKEHEDCKARHGKTPARYFYELGVFDSPTTAAHCVATEPEDWALMKEKGVTAVHNPTSNMKLASGFMPIRQLLEIGVNVSIGTDGTASNNNLNLFEEMHIASIIHNGYHESPTLLTPGEVLKMATLNGAKSQGRTLSGNLRPGMRADITAINLDRPHLKPGHDIEALLVYAAQASDVALTMVNGKILYEDGEYLTIDRDRALYDIDQAAKRIGAQN